jgi:branched-chain amino acid aminotransferase
MNERIVYHNGAFVPEREALIPFRDRSFRYGDGVFDVTRTFRGRLFRLEEHVARLYASLRYARIDPGLAPEEMIAVTREVLERNRHLLDPDSDYWVGQRLSRGIAAVGDEGWENADGPTIIVDCMPLPLKARARLFRDGVDVIVPSVRRVSPSALTPRAKSHNYLNLIMADLEVKAQNPEAWAVLLDENGNLSEGMGSNIFLVKDGALLTPRERFVLPGISRLTVMELAEAKGIAVKEADLDLYDAYTADEAFLTSTSLCICPVGSVNGAVIGDGTVPGPVIRGLTEAYVELVDCDFVRQYLDKLD